MPTPQLAPAAGSGSPAASLPRWTVAAVGELYRQPLFRLIEQAHATHNVHHPAGEVQLCHLLSIKTGGCPEDCAYCPQSARHATAVAATPLLDAATVLEDAHRAKAAGATRFCMGAAWRQPKPGPEFDRVLGLVRGVAEMGLEVCCTLGMLDAGQARQLAAAGLTAYNHNLDTSPEFYNHIITTRVYEDRLRTIENVRQAGISVCCGGILGMGESEQDRVALLATLANLDPPPESVPINALVAVAGTPLAEQRPVDGFEFVRAIATARILMPRTKVRLSAGRMALAPEAQALCFYAGANSIFVGEKLLTTPNPGWEQDHALLERLGLRPEPAAATASARPAAHGLAAPSPAAPSPAAVYERAWEAELEAIERQHRLRALPAAAVGGDFCSNDYLDLSRHPAVRAAVERALAEGMALGATGSPLVSGHHPAMAALEAGFADWVGTEAALLYSSGYAANLGLLTALLRPQDIVFSDAANHASLIDGLRLSGARRVIVPHNDAGRFEEMALRHPALGDQRRFLVVESVYSMEGDLAPLEALAGICADAGIGMIVDEAHATGLFGPAGAGRVRALRAEGGDRGAVVATVHPCGKALGASGAVVAGSRRLAQYLVNRSRSFIYSTAPSPLLAVQIAAAMEVIRREPQRRAEVAALARSLRQQLRRHGLVVQGAEEAPIVPVVVGEAERALAAEAALARSGWRARAIRPPSVPAGTARLRLTVHIGQSEADGAAVAAALATALAGAAVGVKVPVGAV